MKKIFVLILMFALSNITVFAADKTQSDNIALLTKKGFFDNSQKNSNSSPFEEIKKTFQLHYKYSNSHNLDGLSSMYADNYMSEDGFNKDIYFKLVKKTWESYPDISYKLTIKDIIVNENTAVVQVNECALAKTPARTDVVNEKGNLKSFSETVYYMERVGNKWLVVSDKILYEKTFLQYGSAKAINVNLIAPSQVYTGDSYTASLKVNQDKTSFIIASIGQELVTYPQTVAKEVFRKLSSEGTLERMFTANSKNLNEYAVASYGVTKAEVKDGKEIKIVVTGLGFIMQRVNVIPKNNYIKADNEKTK